MFPMENNYWVLAFYLFIDLEDPEAEVALQKKFFTNRDVTCRIYLSKEGFNGQMSLIESDAIAYMEWMERRFGKVDFKVHRYHEHVFPRLTVKVRNQLVALDETVDMADRGEPVAPALWKKMLEERDESTLLLDVRNGYEWEVGHFEGAKLPNLETFRQFPAFAKKLKDEVNPKETKVMMYCTGGIRCELYSALLKKEGFEQVYQLQGGVINYGLEEGSQHWKGKLFVFDDRMAVPISEKESAEVVGKCRHCCQPSEVFYNCANMDCNELFLACPACSEQKSGCCSSECQKAPRLRPFVPTDRPKPFRKIHKSCKAASTSLESR